MNDQPEPDPELLAAYFDGALNGRADLRRRVEDWLAGQPDGDSQDQLRQLWQETAPPEPSAAAWQGVFRRISPPRRPARAPRRLRPALALAAAACVALLVWGGGRLLQPALDPGDRAQLEVLPVATAEEVVILLVEGADTQTLVVGQLPVQGPLLLADPGDVERISSEPDASDRMVPHFRLHGPDRPMIWARLGEEKMP